MKKLLHLSRTLGVVALTPACWLFAQACGGTTDATPVVDAGHVGDDAGDAGEAPDTSTPVDPNYPAQHTPMPLVDNNGGRVLEHAHIVTITWASDDPAMVARLQKLDDTITQTPWWTAVGSEYCEKGSTTHCIGAGTPGEHVVIQSAPPSAGFTDSSQGGPSSIQDFLKDRLANDPSFPAPTVDTLYAIYLPDGVSIDLDGTKGCENGGFGAYHNTVDLQAPDAGLMTTAYAVTPRCGSKESTTTISATHEFIEAATDPDIGQNNLTYYMLNQAWGFAGGEVGDLCVDFVGGNDTVQESGFTAQRSWSNKSAKAGHDPCVPIPQGEVYFQVAPRKQQITLKKVGDQAVLDLDAFSDGPMPDWTVSAFDFATFQTGTAVLDFSFDRTQVNNGTHAQVTVTLKKAMPQGATVFAIGSKDGAGHQHFWPVLALQH